MKKIILASASPRRRELLTQIGLEFEIIPSHKDEVIGSEGPADTVMALAAGKAEDIYAQVCSGRAPEDVLVIGADTVVAMDGLILGKPADAAQALDMLRRLQGKTHQVYTGVCLMTADGCRTFYEKTDVTMYPADDRQLRDYISTGEPMDKAGSYGIQGLGAILVREIHGEYNNVVGLPVAAIWQRISQDENMKKFIKVDKE